MADGGSDDDEIARAARRHARARWSGRVTRLGDDDFTPMPDAVAARIAAVWELTLQSWRLAGRALPDYERANMPARLFRPGEARE